MSKARKPTKSHPAKASVSAGMLFNQALAHHEAGRLQEAATVYRRILAASPENAGALCNLGLVSCQMGAHEAALPYLERAVAITPDSAEIHATLGQALKQLGQTEAALASYRWAARLQAGNPWCHYNVGVVLQQLARIDDALASYQEALRLAPQFPQAHNNLGRLLEEKGLIEDAAASYRRAIQLSPEYFEAHFNLGKALMLAGQTEEAASAFVQAIGLRRDDHRVLIELGSELGLLGRPKAAAAVFERVLSLRQDSWEAQYNLGCAQIQLGEHAAAVESFSGVLRQQPDFAEAHCNLGIALTELGRNSAAEASLRQALALRPDFPAAQNNLGLVLKDMGRHEEAMASFQGVLDGATDPLDAHSNLLFTMNLLPAFSPARMREAASDYGREVSANVVPYQVWRTGTMADKPLRIGLVSGDLRQHPVGFFLEGVLKALDSRLVALFAYSSHHREDQMTERLRPRFAGWVNVAGMADEVLARHIHDDAIDILIDLSGHTGYNRLPVFAWKPAPVQFTWLGYFATTGLAQMDYILGDHQVAPMAESNHFFEKVWRLPEIYYCFTPPAEPVQPAELPALNEGFITFGCFNKLSKIHDVVVQTWSRILLGVPGSRLFLKSRQLNDSAMREAVMARFAVHGIGQERLLLEGHSHRTEYLTAYNRVDFALDPFPFPGGTTTVEGLWMGVPAVTLKGDRFIGHQGETILHNAGLADWIAQDLDDYVAKAVAFAGDLAALSELRGRLRGQLLASPVCDAPRFARHFEAALRGMWRRWCDSSLG